MEIPSGMEPFFSRLPEKSKAYLGDIVALKQRQQEEQLLMQREREAQIQEQMVLNNALRDRAFSQIDEEAASLPKDALGYGAVRHEFSRERARIDRDTKLANHELSVLDSDPNFALSFMKQKKDELDKEYGFSLLPFNQTEEYKNAVAFSKDDKFKSRANTIDLLTNSIESMTSVPPERRSALAMTFLTSLINSAKGTSDAEQQNEFARRGPELLNYYQFATANGKSIFNPATITAFLGSKPGIEFSKRFSDNPEEYLDKAVIIRNDLAKTYNEQARNGVIVPTSPAISKSLDVYERKLMPTFKELEALKSQQEGQPAVAGGSSFNQPQQPQSPQNESAWKTVGKDILAASAPTIRGAGPIAAGALLGAAAGAPLGGVGAVPGALAGAGAAALTEMVGDPATALVNKVFGLNLTPPSKAFQDILTSAGVPESQGAFQRAVESGVRGAAEVASGVGVGKALAVSANSQVAKAIGAGMMEDLGAQAIAGGAAGVGASAAQSAAEELGAGPIAQGVAAFAGGITGGVGAVGGVKAAQAIATPRAQRLQQAAQEAASSMYSDFAVDPIAAREKIREFRNSTVNTADFNPMTGDITGDSGLAAIQQAMYNRSSAVRQRFADTVETLSKKGADTFKSDPNLKTEASEWFSKQNNDLLDAAENIKQSYLQQGDERSASILTKAQSQIDALNSAMAEDMISAETGFNLATRKLQEAKFEIAQARGIKQDVDTAAKEIFENEAKTAKSLAQQKFIESGAEQVPVEFNNTYRAAKEAAGEVSKIGGVPAILDKIIKSYAPKKKTPYSDTALELSNAMSDLTDAWFEARQQNPKQARLLANVKQAMLKDLEAAGDVSEALKDARKAWFDYASTYINGPAENIAEKTSFVGSFMQKGKAGAEQLKNALKVDSRADAASAVTDWFVNDLAQTFGEAPTAANIQKWKTSNKIKPLLEVFPDADSKINQLSDSVAKAEGSVGRFAEVKAGLKADEIQMAKPYASRLLNEANRLASAAEKAGERLGVDAIAKAKDEIAQNAATRFVGADPVLAFEGLLKGSKNPVADFDNILTQAAKDPSGAAYEGVISAAKQAFNREIRNAGQVVSTSNIPGVVKADDLALSLSKMNKILLEDTTKRAILERIYADDPDALAALDIVRKQTEIVSRRLRGAAQVSPTSLNKENAIQVDAALADTALGLVGKIASGVTAEQLRRDPRIGLAGKIVSAIKTAWVGDVQTAALKILEQANLDPEIAYPLLLKINTQDGVNRTMAFLSPILKASARQSSAALNKVPFSPGSVQSEKVGNQLVVHDLNYGYRAITTPSGKVKVFSPSNKLEGVYDTMERAQAEAVRKFQSSKNK
jgi:hypothetical protein